MTQLTISGYRFVTLTDLEAQQRYWQRICNELALKGTILLSTEGININLSGASCAIATFKTQLAADANFSAMRFHEFHADTPPYKKLKVKIKNEIITFRKKRQAKDHRAASVSPAQLKQWLDENRDITLLDTRNDYEVAFGTFNNAVHLHLKHFTDLPAAIQTLEQQKPIVMFCTGGIRCEKAALYMQDQGFNEVYQLDGGILGYFSTVGMQHYTGTCFVFDGRETQSADV